MYSSYDEASRCIIGELDKVSSLPHAKRAYLRSVLSRALMVDTNHTLTRSDFLSKEIIRRALRNNSPVDQTILDSIRRLFPRTWKVVENCK